MTKRVDFGQRKPLPSDADTWVEHRVKESPAGEEVKPVKMKRLTIDIPDEMHRRFKIACATRDVRMADAIREMLAREYM